MENSMSVKYKYTVNMTLKWDVVTPGRQLDSMPKLAATETSSVTTDDHSVKLIR